MKQTTLSDCESLAHCSQLHKHKSMVALNSCDSRLLLLPKTTTTTTASATNTKTHLRLHHQHHHHHVQLLHFSSLKAHFKSTLPSPPSEEEEEEEEEEDSSPPEAGSSSSSSLTTVNFLMDSGGLSYVQVQQVMRKMPTLLNNGGRKPRSVIAYLESIGFSKTHISKAISKCPRFLVADVENTLKPKIQLFQDFGFSESDIVDLMASRPIVLRTGLKTHLKPGLDLLKSFVKTDEDLIKIIKRNNSLLFSTTWRSFIEPNIDVLRQLGVPDSYIVYLMVAKLTTLMSTPELFKTVVERILSLGFKPETRKFTVAVAVMCGMRKATWDSKVDLLKGLGWSDEQILDAFRRFPIYLAASGEKMKEGIEFFKESLNWDTSVVSQYPFLLSHGLKKRVIPRYAVLKCLMSKEIIKEDTMLVYAFKLTETHFLSKYIFKYQDQLPYLYELYKKECMMGCEEDNGEITSQQDLGDVDMTV